MSKKFLNKPQWKLGTFNVFDHNIRSTHERRTILKTKNNNDDKGKDWGSIIKAQLYGEDVVIGNIAGPSRPGNKFNYKRTSSIRPALNMIKSKLYKNPSGWYGITIPNGNKYDKQILKQTLLKILNPLPFRPISWTADSTSVIFYVNDYKVAEKLHAIDHAIEMPDGFKMILKVKYGSPHVNITEELKDKIKLALKKRYNPANKSLDLTRFHCDPILEDWFCVLYKPTMLCAVFDIIDKNFPELEALSLNDNNIRFFWLLRRIVHKLKNVRILHLAHNRIRDVSMLNTFAAMPLVELRLDGNPLCDQFKEKAIYISEVRNIFPKIIKLDDIDLPPPMSFDIEHKELPRPCQTFLCNAQGGPFMRQFLEHYFQLLDSNNRQLLVQAYHENAIFSITMAYPYKSPLYRTSNRMTWYSNDNKDRTSNRMTWYSNDNKDRTSNWLSWYSFDNRNLKVVTDSERRFKLLKKGPESIVSFLKDMPRTSHDIMNFKVDLTSFTPFMISLTVFGMFKEFISDHVHPPIRSFSRTLVIIPTINGFCICNEELHITNATEDQIKTFKCTPMPPLPDLTSLQISIPDESVPNTSVPNAPLIPEVDGVDNLTKQLEALSMQSGMNLEWSSRCLEENEWNFDRATKAFNELQKKGSIPAEAFMK